MVRQQRMELCQRTIVDCRSPLWLYSFDYPFDWHTSNSSSFPSNSSLSFGYICPLDDITFVSSCSLFVEEATIHFRKAFPNLVRINDDRILSSFVRMSKKLVRQRFIENGVFVFTYSNDQDRG